MASEHVHQWERYHTFGEPAEVWHRICTASDCGQEETYREEHVQYVTVDKADLERRDQQLAQEREAAIHLRSEKFKLEAQVRFEREENARQLALRLQLQHRLDQAQALLGEAVQDMELDHWGEQTVIDKIRAFLAGESDGQSDGK